MAQLIKHFRDGSWLEFDQGAFDAYCIYYCRPHKDRLPPKDARYFKTLIRLADRHGADTIHNDFITIFEQTSNRIEAHVLADIEAMSARYPDDSLLIEQIFTILYAGMIAEENKRYTRLGKRVKRLGMFQILKGGMSAEAAANFSRGKPWRELDALCKEYGF